MIYENPSDGHYVRFVRGTEANWNQLTHKDPHTLYFIVASNGQSGKLYLGTILIGGTSASGGSTSSISLADLSDVIISTVGNRDILLYNSTSGQWENTSVDTLLASAVANANHLKYTIVTSLNDIDTTADDADRYIYLVPKTASTNDSYDEYMYINGSLEKVGTWDTDLSNYVTLTTFNTRVGAIEDILQDTVDDNSGDTVPGLVSRVETIEDILNDTTDLLTGETIPGLVSVVASFPDIYVLKSKYEAEVGDTSQLVNSTGSQNAPTLVQQVNDLTDRLTWYEITNSNS